MKIIVKLLLALIWRNPSADFGKGRLIFLQYRDNEPEGLIKDCEAAIFVAEAISKRLNYYRDRLAKIARNGMIDTITNKIYLICFPVGALPTPAQK